MSQGPTHAFLLPRVAPYAETSMTLELPMSSMFNSPHPRLTLRIGRWPGEIAEATDNARAPRRSHEAMV